MNAAALDRAAKFIAPFEGFRPDPYRDAVGVWTIGYGETQGVGPNTPPVTELEARMHLRQRLERDYAPAIDRMGLSLNVNQQAALLSAVYNLGPGVLDRGRSLGDALYAHAWDAAADALLLYDKAGGRALAGLTRRRRAERALFLTPPTASAAQVRAWRKDLKGVRARLAKLRARARQLKRKIGGKP